MKKKIILLTGSELRHAFYAKQLSKYFNLIGIVIEKKRNQIKNINKTPFILKHQQDRINSEKNYFGEYSFEEVGKDFLTKKQFSINDEDVFNWVSSKKPDLIFVYGTSIIKEPLLNKYNNCMINMHLGLSPYYKGSATNIWPLVNGQPECVGATFHFITKKVDAGPIIHQFRPMLNADDNIHDIGNKTISATRYELKKTLDFLNSESQAVPQIKGTESYVYKKDDFNEKKLKKAYENISKNIISKYLKNKKNRDMNFKIVEF